MACMSGALCRPCGLNQGIVVIPHGKHEGAVVSASSDHNLRVWDIDSVKCSQVLSGHTAEVHMTQSSVPTNMSRCDAMSRAAGVSSRSVAEEPSRKRKLGSFTAGVAHRQGDMLTGNTPHSHMQRHAYRVELSPRPRTLKNSWLNTAHRGGTFTRRHVTCRVCLQELKGHTADVSCIAVLPNGNVVSGSADYSLRVCSFSPPHCVN